MNINKRSSEEHAVEQQHWLACELHDGLLQWIIAARMQIAAAIVQTRDFPQRSQSENLSRLNQVKSLLDIAAEEGRSLIQFVDQTSTAPIEAAELVSEFVDTVQSSSIPHPPISVIQDGKPWPKLDSSLAWSIYRLLQQAIQNAITHSQAKRVDVVLGRTTDQALKATVIDDGIGFDPAQDRPNHFGLRSMRHRATLCGGQLKIQSSPGRGCEVSLIIPISVIEKATTSSSA